MDRIRAWRRRGGREVNCLRYRDGRPRAADQSRLAGEGTGVDSPAAVVRGELSALEARDTIVLTSRRGALLKTCSPPSFSKPVLPLSAWFCVTVQLVSVSVPKLLLMMPPPSWLAELPRTVQLVNVSVPKLKRPPPAVSRGQCSRSAPASLG